MSFVDKKKKRSCRSESSSNSQSISLASIKASIDKLMWERHRDSTRHNYHSVWRSFSEFYLKLDTKPETWEERISLYAGYLIASKKKSSTVKSYISAVKAILCNDGRKINEDKILLSAITMACHLKNDEQSNKLPIRKGVINMLLTKLGSHFRSPQPYLIVMYRALIITIYFGLFRIGEVTSSPHVVKACNVHIRTNKNKVMFVLHMSKTHDRSSKPQIIKITEVHQAQIKKSVSRKIAESSRFCPFQLLKQYLSAWKDYISSEEQFFVFTDRSSVKPHHLRSVLKQFLIKCNLDYRSYSCHGIRAGQASDMLDMGISVETIRKIAL